MGFQEATSRSTISRKEAPGTPRLESSVVKVSSSCLVGFGSWIAVAKHLESSVVPILLGPPKVHQLADPVRLLLGFFISDRCVWN
jgi:hypothetical protein